MNKIIFLKSLSKFSTYMTIGNIVFQVGTLYVTRMSVISCAFF